MPFNTQNIINIIILKKQGGLPKYSWKRFEFSMYEVDLQYRANFGISVKV